MKTILTTTFAIAVMAFAFNTNPATAAEDPQNPLCKQSGLTTPLPNECYKVSEVEEPDQADDERAVADSGEEGSTSAAGSDQ